MEKYISKVIDQFIENKIIKMENRVIYEYGLKQGIIIIFNLLTIILIGIISGHMIIAITFMLTYVPLRTYAGGYHASNPITCYIISVSIEIIAILLVLFFGEINIFFSIPIAIILYYIAPVDSITKKLGNRQKMAYKKKTAVILIILFIISILFHYMKVKYIKNTIIIAELLVGVFAIIGYIKNNFNQI